MRKMAVNQEQKPLKRRKQKTEGVVTFPHETYCLSERKGQYIASYKNKGILTVSLCSMSTELETDVRRS